MKNPYAASQTRDTEIMETEWPLATTSQLADSLKTEARYKPEEINQGVHKLIMARKAIGDARLACAAAIKEHKREDVKTRLREVMSELDAAMKRLPLTVLETRSRRRGPGKSVFEFELNTSSDTEVGYKVVGVESSNSI